MAEIKQEKLEVSKLPPVVAAASTRPAIVAEFRGQTCDLMKWTDKQSGKAREMQKLNVSAEFAESGVQIALELLPPPGGTVVEPLPYKKGDLVLFELGSYTSSRESGHRGRVVSHNLYRGVA